MPAFNPYQTNIGQDPNIFQRAAMDFRNTNKQDFIGGVAGLAANASANFLYKPYVPNIPSSTITDPTTSRPVYNLGTRDEIMDA